MILEFLMKHEDKAFFSKNIAEASKRYGVKTRDIMRTVRGYEKKSLVYDKRYVTDNKQTPFKKGYLITWFEQKRFPKTYDRGSYRKNQ